MNSGIKVFAPASISNLGCGFDTLGMALSGPGDEIIAKFCDKPGLHISKITGAKGRLPLDSNLNTAGKSALALLEYLGESKRGIDFEIHKKMPFGSGLGSSAASAVAGVMAVNELLRKPLEKKDLLPFALEGERLASGSLHADNVAPSLLGGVIFVRSHDPVDTHRLPCPPGLYISAVYPHVEILTKDARSVLRPDVPLSSMVKQAANLGAFVIGFYRMDLDLISRSMVDWVIEPQRAHLIPHFYEVQKAALEAGALGCTISGAGPTIFALCANSFIAENVAEQMQRIYRDYKVEHDLFLSPVNQDGAIKC
ncbi:MAG: homoserine kinase [Saprospiraceae bacterium]|nr:homoserine kinase [Saprospiraceae bacterium]